MSKLINLFTGFLFISFSSMALADSNSITNNPVLPGDFPDPSIIRVNNDYWATATSSEWAPEFPILHSTDLVNWDITGAVFKSRPGWTIGNFWAPEISFYKNKYYVYYTAHKKDGPLCVAVASSDKPDSGYSDHGPLVCQDAGSIDAMPVTDKDGARYLIWKEDGNSRNQPTPIWAQKFSDDGTKLTGEKVELLKNDPNSWEGNLVEAPFIMRHGNMYYMFYSGNGCCGNSCTYALGVARSASLLGPWEKNPANPILKGNDMWKCPGHGSVVTDNNGKNFLLYHAYNTKSNEFVGRQGLIDQVTWSNNWPAVNNGNGPSADGELKFIPANKNKLTFNDEFNKDKIDNSWQWPQYAEPGIRVFKAKGGSVQVSSKSAKDLTESSALIAHSTTTSDYTAEVSIDLKSVRLGAMAGISAFGDKENALGLAVKGNNLLLWKREKNQYQILKTIVKQKANMLYIKMSAKNGSTFSFQYSGDNKTWFKLDDKVEGAFLPPWDRGVRVALTVGGIADAYASFANFKLIPQ